MSLVGYTDPLIARPGDTVSVMVSCSHPAYEADLVRVIHGDVRGPGVKLEPVSSPLAATYPGREQKLARGSSIVLPDTVAEALTGSWTYQSWIWPTAVGPTPQSIFACGGREAGAGFVLGVDAEGALTLWRGDEPDGTPEVTTGGRLLERRWSLVACAYDAAAGQATLWQLPAPAGPTPGRAEGQGRFTAPLPGGPVRIAAAGGAPGWHYNGKLERPRLFAEALGGEAIAALAAGDPPADVCDQLRADWDLGGEMSCTEVHDQGSRGLHGRVLGMPARAMTGRLWTGDVACWRDAPEQYGAIHFHDDDLEDAGWAPDFELAVEPELRSGVYAIRLRADGEQDLVPLIVSAARRAPRARVAVMLPTVSYLIYANEHLTYQNPRTPPVFERIVDRLSAEDHYIARVGLHSCYDHHGDGSGVMYASWKRPMMTLRAGYSMALVGAPHQLPADLHLLDWLEARHLEYEVITDHDLHRDGQALLDEYRVVLTGSHPEYWTTAMLDGLDGYLASGGRFMYLGGNGLYWVTAIHPQLEHVVELRRGNTQGAIWSSEPGEEYHAFTGELGGTWDRRGRGITQTGVWFTAQGFDRSHPYRRLPASSDPRARFIFDGVAENETIGDFGLCMGGAAGFEIDRADYRRGTPAHALVVATADAGFSASYDGLDEDWLVSDYQAALQERLGPPAPGNTVQFVQGPEGPTNPLVRCDMVFFETPQDGAVFSTGSIAWCGALSHDGYVNNVSRITENVVRTFAQPGPLPR